VQLYFGCHKILAKIPFRGFITATDRIGSRFDGFSTERRIFLRKIQYSVS
jgi:hypothetical protein